MNYDKIFLNEKVVLPKESNLNRGFSDKEFHICKKTGIFCYFKSIGLIHRNRNQDVLWDC